MIDIVGILFGRNRGTIRGAIESPGVLHGLLSRWNGMLHVENRGLQGGYHGHGSEIVSRGRRDHVLVSRSWLHR
jgi:hypothetical protein